MPTLDELIAQKRGQSPQIAPTGRNLQDLINQRRQGQGPQPLISLDIGQQDRTRSLQRQLGGRLPTQGPLPQFVRPPGGTFGGAAIVSSQLRQREQQRRDAFKRLLDLGFSSEEISGALSFEQAIKPPSRLPRHRKKTEELPFPLIPSYLALSSAQL